MKDLTARLQARRDAHLYRLRRVTDTAQQPVMQVNGSEMLSFCSNDYLGLAADPDVTKAFIKGAQQWGVGSGAAHLVNGHSRAHHELEEALAEFTGRDRALLFSTGYMANIGIAQAMLDAKDAVFEDRLNHASLIDAGLISKARFQRYPHNDPEALAERLNRSEAADNLVMTDGVFSMDGDIAPLPALAYVCERHSAWLMVDDAHGIGVLGDHGSGSCEHFDLDQKQVPILMGTLGKALGTGGAFVAGSEALIEHLIQAARTYVFTTAMPPAIAAATLTSLEKVKTEAWRRHHLQTLISHFRTSACQLDLPLLDSPTPIQGIVTGSAENALKLSQALWQQGIHVTAIRPPTVPEGTARLRITLTASHTVAQVDRLLDSLSAAIQPSA